MQPKIIFEIGTGQLELCRTRKWWRQFHVEPFCHLFEPLPKFCDQINNFFNAHGIKNAEITQCAIHEENKVGAMWAQGECSFLADEKDLVHQQSGEFDRIQREVPKIPVQYRRIDEFDKGNIDALLVDTEGTEWYSLKNLISRPKLIVLETHMRFGATENHYRNPFMDEINNWMNENKYTLTGKNDSDSFYVKNEYLDRAGEILGWL